MLTEPMPLDLQVSDSVLKPHFEGIEQHDKRVRTCQIRSNDLTIEYSPTVISENQVLTKSVQCRTQPDTAFHCNFTTAARYFELDPEMHFEIKGDLEPKEALSIVGLFRSQRSGLLTQDGEMATRLDPLSVTGIADDPDGYLILLGDYCGSQAEIRVVVSGSPSDQKLQVIGPLTMTIE
jgi:hypothetical protein